MPSSSPYSKAAIKALVAGLDKRHVWHYLQKVHKIDIVCKGNRNIPSKLEIIKKIHALRNISVVIADIQRMKLMKLEKPGSKLESDKEDEEKDEEKDDEEEDEEEKDSGEEEEDDVIEDLKAELAARGKKTHGNSLMLVRRLLNSLSEE